MAFFAPTAQNKTAEGWPQAYPGTGACLRLRRAIRGDQHFVAISSRGNAPDLSRVYRFRFSPGNRCRTCRHFLTFLLCRPFRTSGKGGSNGRQVLNRTAVKARPGVTLKLRRGRTARQAATLHARFGARMTCLAAVCKTSAGPFRTGSRIRWPASLFCGPGSTACGLRPPCRGATTAATSGSDSAPRSPHRASGGDRPCVRSA